MESSQLESGKQALSGDESQRQAFLGGWQRRAPQQYLSGPRAWEGRQFQFRRHRPREQHAVNSPRKGPPAKFPPNAFVTPAPTAKENHA